MKNVYKFLLILVLAVLLPVVAFAQPAPWSALNDNCRGEPLLRANLKQNPVCVTRDTLTKDLQSKGWLLAAHDVWLSPAEQGWFIQALNRTETQMKADPSAMSFIVPGLITDLRTKLTDVQIFAAWNALRPLLVGFFPQGSAVLQYGLDKLEMHYSSKNDPRYVLER